MEEAGTVQEFDPEDLRWQPAGPSAAPAGRPRDTRPRPKPRERFLKGPISWPWLEAAARQPGKALHVAMALQHRAGMKKSRTVTLNLSRLGSLGVSRSAGSLGLKALRAAGLIAFDGRQGRTAVVTILDVPTDVAREGA